MQSVGPAKLTMSITEAAAVLGISRAAAYRLADSGELPVIRLGLRTLRVPTHQLIAQFNLA